jgi:glucan 1,3-beta-glucosidase
MTPSLFTCASGTQGAEIDIAYGWQSPTDARAVLERHWDTFITEADFQYLSSIGINTVRLPIGYWNLGPQFMQGTAFEWVSQVYQNSWFRVVRAINQAGRAGLGVIVDLHGAVGSQNGQQHSGVSDGKTGLFSDPGNMDKTIAVLTFLTQQLAPVNNVVGIQVLNEPVYDPGLENFCESFAVGICNRIFIERFTRFSSYGRNARSYTFC